MKAADAPERLLLVGMMGVGKSTVGRLLAARLSWPYLDSDEEVERSTGRSVPRILEEDGEAAFRSAESEVLRRAVEQPPPLVVSVAGGAVLDAGNRRSIARAGTVVWLRAEPATLATRVGEGVGRPLLEPDPPEAVRRLDAVRRPFYAELADVVVDVDRRPPQAVADVVLASCRAQHPEPT